DLIPLIPRFLAYVLSFLYVGIYWNNHHHLIKASTKVSGKILWANLILLFSLSLFPFTTAWMAENHFAPWPTVFYAIVLLMAAIFYYLLQKTIINNEDDCSILQQAVGDNKKEKISMIFYFIAIFTTFIHPFISQLLFLAVALFWIIPDPRIEKVLD
ncbi:MAG: TMEM175 family protein, partial [Methanobrevibacter sp.]|nr:TMEM175 family protein [Methanobrevibacter sp.]